MATHRLFGITGAIRACVAAAALLWCRPVAAQTPETLTYAQALERALAANPAILAARSRQAISSAGLEVAAERLNPEVRTEFDRDVPHQAYSVAIPLELGGKRARRIDVAKAEAATTDAEIAQLIAETRTALRRAYFERLSAEARVGLLDEVQGILSRARDAAQQRFDAGSSPRLEVLQAGLELSQAENESVGAHGAAAAARARFNALLGMPGGAATTIASSEVDTFPAVDAAVTRARSASAELALYDRRLEAQRARVALAKSLQTPDLTPEGSWTHGFEPGSDFQSGWKVALAITVPVFTTHKAGVALEEATLAQLSAERVAVEMRIVAEVTAVVATAESQRQQVLRYRSDILPQALQVERMADDAYRLGQTGITAYLQALQATRDIRLKALQAEADLQAALADLEEAMGAPLTP